MTSSQKQAPVKEDHLDNLFSTKKRDRCILSFYSEIKIKDKIGKFFQTFANKLHGIYK